jgi:iron complex outermembrane recepter protein
MHDLLVALAITAFAAHPPVTTDTSAPAAGEVRGTVVDTAGAPIPDARVAVIELRRTIASGPEGRFAFSEIANGVYHLSVSAIGFAPWSNA